MKWTVLQTVRTRLHVYELAQPWAIWAGCTDQRIGTQLYASRSGGEFSETRSG